jgi:hypothetical protein
MRIGLHEDLLCMYDCVFRMWRCMIIGGLEVRFITVSAEPFSLHFFQLFSDAPFPPMIFPLLHVLFSLPNWAVTAHGNSGLGLIVVLVTQRDEMGPTTYDTHRQKDMDEP